MKIIFILLLAFLCTTKSISQSIKLTKVEGISEKQITFIQKNIRYPRISVENNIEGNEVIALKINAKGEIIEMKIRRSIGEPIDNEVKRVLLKLKNLEPIRYKGKSITTWIYFSFRFSLFY